MNVLGGGSSRVLRRSLLVYQTFFFISHFCTESSSRKIANLLGNTCVFGGILPGMMKQRFGQVCIWIISMASNIYLHE